MNYKVIENLLDVDEFEKLKDIFTLSSYLPWYFNERTTSDKNDKDFMFTHTIYLDNEIKSDVYGSCVNLFFAVSQEVQKNKLLRIKANLYTNQNKNIFHKVHVDYENLENYKTAVYNFTTCNGGTILFFENEKIDIPSIENSLIVFDGNIKHQGYTQSDTSTRVLLNFDFC